MSEEMNKEAEVQEEVVDIPVTDGSEEEAADTAQTAEEETSEEPAQTEETEQSVCKLLDLLFKFIFLFFLLTEERSFCLGFRFLLRFLIVSVVEGNGLLNHTSVKKGDHFILPYGYGKV